MPLVVDDLRDLTDLLEQHEEWQLPLLRLLISKKNVRELLVQDTELLLILRGLIVGEELSRLPTQVEEVKQIALQAVEKDVAELKKTTEELRVTTNRIDTRQRGLEGQLRGAAFEKRVRRQAFRLFNGGEGGTAEEPRVEARLREWLVGRADPSQRIRDIDDPTLADLIWWKGERVAVVEASVQVNGEDVRRARLRAETLRQAGVDALPIVIGEEWATPDSRELAEQEGVAWKVGDELSQGFVEFRALNA